MRENRGPWYLLTGLMIGLIAGLVYGWVIEPVQYVDALPNALSAQSKDTYRAMIALAYQADANLGRARQRLALLNDSSPAQALSSQSQRLANPFSSEGKALAALADAYLPQATKQATATPSPTATPEAPTLTPTEILSPTATLDPALAVQTATPQPTQTPTPTLPSTATSEVTVTPAATLTPRATLRPSPTLGAPFALKDKQPLCDPALPSTLAVNVLNSAGEPVAGAQIRVTWDPNGLDTFYTGLAPEISPGYADFQMQSGVTYAVQVGDNGQTVSGLTTRTCQGSDSGTYTGGWTVNFIQP